MDSSEDETLCINMDPNESYFDSIVGQIEDILVNEHFQTKIDRFADKYCRLFDRSDENKFIYTDIFNEYIEMLEDYLNTYLINRIPTFNMDGFLQMIEEKQNELNGEVFDVLLSMTDFLNFKDMMLDYKDNKEGFSVNSDEDLLVKGYSNSR